MAEKDASPSFKGDDTSAVASEVCPDRRELALVAIERTRMPMVITDPRQEDNPIVLANHAFLDLTGYTADEVLGRNCRFLQGPETSRADVDTIRRKLAANEDQIDIELLNYRKDGSTFWNQLAISAVYDADGELIYYFGSQKNVSERRRAQELEATERLLLMEVDHRALNALSLVKSIIALSRKDNAQSFAESVAGRVDALARAHQLLAASGWGGARLPDLIAAEAHPKKLVLADGPDAELPPHLVQPLAVVLHELVSNALHHGSLAHNPECVRISWEVTPQALALHWLEEGVSSAGTPEPGLGLTLIKGVIERQLGGKVTLDWLSDCLRADIVVPWK